MLAVSLAVGCGGKKEPADESPENEPAVEQDNKAEAVKDTIIFAMASEPTTLNPYDHAAVTSSYMNQLTYNKLIWKVTVNL